MYCTRPRKHTQSTQSDLTKAALHSPGTRNSTLSRLPFPINNTLSPSNSPRIQSINKAPKRGINLYLLSELVPSATDHIQHPVYGF